MLQHLVELRGANAQGSGHDVERAWQSVTQLATQFFGLHLALRHHLTESAQCALGFFAAQVQFLRSFRHREKYLARLPPFERGTLAGGLKLRPGLRHLQHVDAKATRLPLDERHLNAGRLQAPSRGGNGLARPLEHIVVVEIRNAMHQQPRKGDAPPEQLT